MSNKSSPSRHPSDAENFFEPNFTADISHKMRVPKHIRASGDSDDNMGNHWISQMDLQEKFEMHVPDRILVIGQEQHIGTKAPPRELQLENAVMPPDPGFVRVQTPPRVISLGDHFIPAADEMNGHPEYPMYKHAAPVMATRNGPMVLNGNGDFNGPTMTIREVTPPSSAADTSLMNTSQMNMTPAEEVLMLRRQVVKLSRRVYAIESEVTQQQQREKVLLAIGIAYFLVKSVIWLSRSPS